MNIADIDPDDPRLTAYALGELEDAADREAVAQLLAASPTIRAEIDEIRRLAHALTAEYDHEREVYADGRASESPPTNLVPFPTPVWRRRAWWSGSLLKVAAVLMTLASLAVWEAGKSSRRRPVETVAMQTAASAPPKLPLLLASPDELQHADLAPAAPTPSSETAAAPPMLALEKPGARREFDESAKDSTDVRNLPMPVAPSAVPQEASSPMIALRAPVLRAAEASKPAEASAAASGVAPKKESDARYLSPALPPTAAGGPLDDVALGHSGAVSEPTGRAGYAEERRLAASLVRVRLRDGKTAAGAVVASSGLILMQGSSASSDSTDAVSVVLDNGASFKVSSSRLLPTSGFRVLKIDASNLTAATLASAVPSNRDSMLYGGLKNESGEVGVRRGKPVSPALPSAKSPAAARLASTGDTRPAEFVFDIEGKLVGVSTGSPDSDHARGRDHTASFYPLSADDRETLTRMISAEQH